MNLHIEKGRAVGGGGGYYDTFIAVVAIASTGGVARVVKTPMGAYISICDRTSQRFSLAQLSGRTQVA